MIIVFPVLTDENISQNIVPGICKSLEKFILVYEMDALSKMIGKKILRIGGSMILGAAADAATGPVASASKAIMAWGSAKTKSEGIVLEDDFEKEVEFMAAKKQPNEDEEDYIKRMRHAKNLGDIEGQKYNRSTRPSEDDARTDYKNQKSRDKVSHLIQTTQGMRDLATTSFKMPHETSLSLEPTWIEAVTTSGTQIIGIKVIPFPVRSKQSLAELLKNESSLKYFDSLILKHKRRFIRAFWAICRAIRVPLWFMKDKVLSGDPEKDILFASSTHRKHVFCMLNYADLQNDELLRTTGSVNQLYSVGWNSFIIVDDVNKRVIYCMKQFSGLCSSTPYSFIYSSFGKEHRGAYNDLETIKKQTTSIFAKTSVSMKRLFGESKNTLENYLKRI